MNVKQNSGQYFTCGDKILPEICLDATQRKVSDGHCKEAFNNIKKTGNMKYLIDKFQSSGWHFFNLLLFFEEQC